MPNDVTMPHHQLNSRGSHCRPEEERSEQIHQSVWVANMTQQHADCQIHWLHGCRQWTMRWRHRVDCQRQCRQLEEPLQMDLMTARDSMPRSAQECSCNYTAVSEVSERSNKCLNFTHIGLLTFGSQGLDYTYTIHAFIHTYTENKTQPGLSKTDELKWKKEFL